MAYHLSYRDFERYLSARFTDAVLEAMTTEQAQGESAARLYVWQRFVRCWGNPVPDPSLYPRSTDCRPAEFADAAHWDATYRKLVRQRTEDARRVHPVWTQSLTRTRDDDEELIDPFDGYGDPSADVEGAVLVDNDLQDLERAIRTDFNVRVAFGPEVRTAALKSIAALRDGADNSLPDLLNEELRRALPESLGEGDSGRQARKRAKDRMVLFVREWAYGRN